jgi:integrase/recombinase XerD
MSIFKERLIVPPASWPTDDRFRWERAIAGHGYKGVDNPAACWSARRRENVEDSYGRYLGWLKKLTGKLPGSSAVEHVTPKNIGIYVAYLRQTLAPWSVTTYFEGMKSFVAVTTPVKDIDWMKARYGKMKARSISTRQKTAHLQHTADLVRFGLALMQEANAAIPPNGKVGVHTALKYQAGFMIALLAIDPLRIRNFQDIEIGRSLVFEQKRYLLRFEADETKTGLKIELPLPAEFEPYLKTLLSTHRPVLTKRGVGKSLSNGLWIDFHGKKMNEPTLRETIKRWTKRKFGKHLWPHLFRDAAATSIAQDDPEHVGVITLLFSHTSIKMMKRHYDQSTSIQASREVAEIIHALRTAEIDPDDEESPF